METTATGATVDKTVTVAVPEDRVAEFYAWYARFLAGPRAGRRGGPRGFRRHAGGHGDHGCGHRHDPHGREAHRHAAHRPAPDTDEVAL